MFATLLGGLPRPDLETALDVDRAIEHAIRVQEEAGLEPITDGRLGDPGFERLMSGFAAWAESGDAAATAEIFGTVIEGWRFAAALTDRAVKQALPGPYTLGRRIAAEDEHRRVRTLAFAEVLGGIAGALAAAGCPLIEIEELDANLIGSDREDEQALFRDAHRRVAAGAGGTHLSLSIVGGSADQAGTATLLDAPYASLAVDLIAGPDNWHLVTQAPPERGVIVGTLSADEALDEPKEVLLWAAHYAATRGRGIDRVGIGSAGSYANLTWAAAVRKINRLGEAARLASLPPGEELARQLDSRAVSARRAALGHPPRPESKSPAKTGDSES